MANWLDNAFYNFDNAILGFWHNLAEGAGGFLTPFMKIVSFFGMKGICMIILGLILTLFKQTRKLGLGALFAILFGFLTTNVLVKNLVARARPYTHAEYVPWWNTVGNPTESEYSFPSGHTTVAMSALTAIFLLSNKKKYTWTLFFGVILMGASRNYLMVHYPTDIIGGIIVGGVSATLSWLLTAWVYRVMERHDSNKFCKFWLNACLINLFRKKENEEK